MSADHQLKFSTWGISHPYTVFFLWLLFFVAGYVIHFMMIYRKVNPLHKKIIIYFYIATAMTIGALLICYFRGK